MPTPIESIRLVADALQSLDLEFAIVGGCAVSLLVDNPEVTDLRPTGDVDLVVEVVTLTEYYDLESRLRKAGFENDTSEGAPICRWLITGCRVDIMPIDSQVLGMNSMWFKEAFETARAIDIGNSQQTKVVTAPLFLATKLSAFRDRSNGDLFGSPDLEDIVTVVDGRAKIVEEMTNSPANVRTYVATGFSEFIRHQDFDDALLGHLSAVFGAREQVAKVKDKFLAIAALAN
jgi:predicted nucleotidyltransferase